MRFWHSILFFILISAYAQAETIVLVGGDTVHGEITEKTDSTIILVHEVFGRLETPNDRIANIIFVHDVLGEVEIQADKIISPAADAPLSAETIVLLSGDTIHGEITEKTDSTITLVHEVFGRLETPNDRIASIIIVHDVLGKVEIQTDKIISPAVVKAKAESSIGKKPFAKKEPQEQKEETEGTRLEPEFKGLNALASSLKKGKWSFAADFSLNTSTGSSDESTTRFGAHIKRTLPRERLAVDMSYYHKVSDGDVTDNKFTAGGIHDWLNPGSRWFFFSAGRYDFDEFESWEHRANIQVGPGYNLIKSDDMMLDLRLGAGGRKEWGSQSSDLKLEGLAGLDFEWKLTHKQTLETSLWLFPVLTDFDDYRTRTTFRWRYLLSKELDLSLLLGVLHEYQSITDPGSENSDTRVYTGIQIEF
jgi:hypothetical protein